MDTGDFEDGKVDILAKLELGNYFGDQAVVLKEMHTLEQITRPA